MPHYKNNRNNSSAQKPKSNSGNGTRSTHVITAAIAIFAVALFALSSFNKNGGSISFKISENDGYILFSVEDEGIGITEEELPFIFERFYRADKLVLNSKPKPAEAL